MLRGPIGRFEGDPYGEPWLVAGVLAVYALMDCPVDVATLEIDSSRVREVFNLAKRSARESPAGPENCFGCT
jgi:hypothetical protein